MWWDDWLWRQGESGAVLHFAFRKASGPISYGCGFVIWGSTDWTNGSLYGWKTGWTAGPRAWQSMMQQFIASWGKKPGYRSRACTAWWRGGKRGSLRVQQPPAAVWREGTGVMEKKALGKERKLVKGTTQIAMWEAKCVYHQNFLCKWVIQLWKGLSRGDLASASMVVSKPGLIWSSFDGSPDPAERSPATNSFITVWFRQVPPLRREGS